MENLNQPQTPWQVTDCRYEAEELLKSEMKIVVGGTVSLCDYFCTTCTACMSCTTCTTCTWQSALF